MGDAGTGGYRDLRRRVTEFERIRPRWRFVVLLFYPAFTLAMAGVALVVGITSSPLELVPTRRLFDPGTVVLLVAVALVFPTIVEIGLRSYWFDQLKARWSALSASLILGAVWAAWHAPRPKIE